MEKIDNLFDKIVKIANARGFVFNASSPTATLLDADVLALKADLPTATFFVPLPFVVNASAPTAVL